MKRFILIILGLFISVSIISNIRNQFNTLKEAKKQNSQIEEKIAKLGQENQILSQKIQYATSEAFLEQEAHDKLGMGAENEMWIELGEEKEIELFPKVNEADNTPKIKQWINLFTR